MTRKKVIEEFTALVPCRVRVHFRGTETACPNLSAGGLCRDHVGFRTRNQIPVALHA